ncbi:hypothetical protein [Kamptonema formosum]|nr:hypothetical protein [Oscillatoria sp. PCC 10802]
MKLGIWWPGKPHTPLPAREKQSPHRHVCKSPLSGNLATFNRHKPTVSS